MSQEFDGPLLSSVMPPQRISWLRIKDELCPHLGEGICIGLLLHTPPSSTMITLSWPCWPPDTAETCSCTRPQDLGVILLIRLVIFTEFTLVLSDSQCSSSGWFRSLRRVDRHRCYSTKSTLCRCQQGGTSGNIPPCSCCRTRAKGCHCCSRSIRSCRPARKILIYCCF